MTGPTLRRFIIAAVTQGCREKFAHGEIVGWKGPMKAHYLVRPKMTGDIVAVLPNIRESETLAPTMLAHLVRYSRLQASRSVRRNDFGASPVHPLGLGHHRLRPQLREDGGQVLEVVDLEVDLHIGEVRRPPGHADIIDIAVVFGDNLRDLGQ
jgi:hypothetical protein